MITKEQKAKKRNNSSEGEATGKKFYKKDEAEENETDVAGDFDQAEIDEVLAAQEFPTKKISKKKIAKKDEPNENEDDDGSNSGIDSPAINYLLSWKNKEKGWKFSKLRQTWLLQNMYNKEKISKQNFKVLLEYLEGLKGAAKQQTLNQAKEFVEETEDTEECSDRTKLKRCLQVLRLLT